jgi:hypothetical protein
MRLSLGTKSDTFSKMRKIEEHTEVKYNFDDDLGYSEIIDRDGEVMEEVLLYNKNKLEGEVTVWQDADQDDREYIILNHTIVYLDTITKRRDVSHKEYKSL